MQDDQGTIGRTDQSPLILLEAPLITLHFKRVSTHVGICGDVSLHTQELVQHTHQELARRNLLLEREDVLQELAKHTLLAAGAA